MLPAVHARHIVDLVKRWGVGADELLGPLGVDEAQLDAPGARLALADVERIVARAVERTGEPGLGFYLALEMRISWHGYLGFAAMTAGTLRETLALVEKYLPTRTTALGLRLVLDGDDPAALAPGEASVVLAENEPLGAAREVVVVGLLLGLAKLGSAITGRELSGRAELALDEPPHFARFRHLWQDVRFGCAHHRLVFPAETLDVPLAMGDPAALRLATERCEEELRALGFDARASARLRALLTSSSAPFPSADDSARALGMSARTLKRRLAEEDTSYSAILDEVRHKRALALLDDKRLSLAEVADRLGYGDAAAFTHAFQRWTGKSPTAHRGGRAPKGTSP